MAFILLRKKELTPCLEAVRKGNRPLKKLLTVEIKRVNIKVHAMYVPGLVRAKLKSVVCC